MEYLVKNLSLIPEVSLQFLTGAPFWCFNPPLNLSREFVLEPNPSGREVLSYDLSPPFVWTVYGVLTFLIVIPLLDLSLVSRS